MPNYVFECPKCWNREDRLLPINKRNSPQTCLPCHTQMEPIPSAPAVSIWDSSRVFPLSPDSEGYTFANKKEYQQHLDDNEFGEVSTDAPNYHKPCVWKKNYGRI